MVAMKSIGHSVLGKEMMLGFLWIETHIWKITGQEVKYKSLKVFRVERL
jgi:hypothetical protein